MSVRTRPRGRWLGWLLLAVVVSSVLGYVVGSQVRSPQEVLAETAPPEDSLLTAEVRSGSIDASENVVGRVRWRSTRTVAVDLADAGVRAVVTATPLDRGDAVGPGTVVAEVSDRPVVVLRGAVPMIRDLRPGDAGADVRRLQEGLQDAGHLDGGVDGVFGPSTLAALADLYDAIGYDLPESAAPDAGGSASGAGGDQRAEGYASASEIVFVPTLPATLLSYPSPTGAPVESDVAELGVGGIVVQADIPTSWAPLLGRRAEQRAKVSVGTATDTVAARVVSVGRARVVEGQGELLPVVVRTARGTLDPSSVGSSVDVTLTDPAAGSGLLVPLSALYSAADLGDFVRVLDDDEQRRVRVRVVATGNGAAAVESVGSGRLQAGDQVVVGVEQDRG